MQTNKFTCCYFDYENIEYLKDEQHLQGAFFLNSFNFHQLCLFLAQESHSSLPPILLSKMISNVLTLNQI